MIELYLIAVPASLLFVLLRQGREPGLIKALLKLGFGGLFLFVALSLYEQERSLHIRAYAFASAGIFLFGVVDLIVAKLRMHPVQDP